MSVTSGFFNSKKGDRVYDATQFSSLFEGIIEDGVFAKVGNALATVQNSASMSVLVRSGRCWFNNVWVNNSTDEPITIAPRDPAGARLDAVCVKVDKSNRTAGLVAVQGTPDNQLTRSNWDSKVWQPPVDENGAIFYVLSYVFVSQTATIITSEDIFSVVGDVDHNGVPLIENALGTVDLSNLLAQYRTQFINWFNTIQTIMDGDVAGNLQHEIEDTQGRWDSITLSASSWNGTNMEYSLESTYPSSEYDILDVNFGDNTTTAQKAALRAAKCTGYRDVNVIKARGVVPVIDINVKVFVRKKIGSGV